MTSSSWFRCFGREKNLVAMNADDIRRVAGSRGNRRTPTTQGAGETRLIGAVCPDFRADLKRILGGDALGIHLQVLLRSARRGPPNLSELFQYGMKRLPPDAGRPDDSLAAYFIVLSELRHCSLKLRIFATECTEYCETEALDGWSRSLSELKATYGTLTFPGP
jgi:hypothetical protein